MGQSGKKLVGGFSLSEQRIRVFFGSLRFESIQIFTAFEKEQDLGLIKFWDC